MILNIFRIEFEHLSEMSVYNNNWYKHKDTGFLINEICDEYANEYTYHGINTHGKFFIGCSTMGMKDNPKIDFQVYYT